MSVEKEMGKAVFESVDIIFTQITKMLLVDKATPEQIMSWILIKRIELKKLLIG